MKIFRIIAAIMIAALTLSACAGAPAGGTAGAGEGTSASTEATQEGGASQPTEGEGEAVDLFGSLFPEDGNIPGKKEIVSLVKDLADNTSRITEINYTFKSGKTSMEVLAGQYDAYLETAKPGESPLQMVYGESEYYNYVLYLPEGYDPGDTETKWPVIYFFHGIGEIGSDLSVLLPYGPLRYLNNGGRLDAVVIAPQCPVNSHWADTDTEVKKLVEFVPEMTARYNIDTDRMYLTGLSMGGRCTWKLALAMPDTFAAIAVVCGRTNTYEFDTIQNMPVWMFHGAQDATVSFDNVNKILTELNANDHRYYKVTVFPHQGHEIWNIIYDRQDVYDWLLNQSLPGNLAEAE